MSAPLLVMAPVASLVFHRSGINEQGGGVHNGWYPQEMTTEEKIGGVSETFPSRATAQRSAVSRDDPVVEDGSKHGRSELIESVNNPLSLPDMYRSSRSVARTVPSGRLFHSSPRFLNTAKPNPAPPNPGESSERRDSLRPDREPPLPERLREATSLLQGYISKTTGDAAINIRKRADGFTAVTQVLFSELGGHLNRATGYEEIELLKKKVETQGMPSVIQPLFFCWRM